MKDPRSVKVADVFRGDERVGTLTRSRQGALFEYAEAFLARHASADAGVSFHLPLSRRRVETVGVNLPAFFAGLLPEGLRLTALVKRLKTSEDDLFSLLIAAGSDTVGDVSVVSAGETPMTAATAPEAIELEKASFQELFAQSLARATTASFESSIPGVQEKLGAAVISFPLAIAKKRSAYILKLNPPDRPRLVENEAFFMKMAAACGLEVAKVQVVRDRDGAAGLLVERFDRLWSKELRQLRRLRQEDACQFLDRYPADKYRLSIREVMEGLSVCAAPILEASRLIRLIAFSYLIANGDLHGKNISVGASGPGGELRLTPAYDLLSTFPYGDRHMALRMEGRDENLRAKTFIEAGARAGVKEAATRAILEELYQRSAPFLDGLEEIGLDDKRTVSLRRELQRRRAALLE